MFYFSVEKVNWVIFMGFFWFNNSHENFLCPVDSGRSPSNEEVRNLYDGKYKLNFFQVKKLGGLIGNLIPNGKQLSVLCIHELNWRIGLQPGQGGMEFYEW